MASKPGVSLQATQSLVSFPAITLHCSACGRQDGHGAEASPTPGNALQIAVLDKPQSQHAFWFHICFSLLKLGEGRILSALGANVLKIN